MGPEHYDKTNAPVWKFTLAQEDGAVLLWVLGHCQVGGWREPTGISLNEMWGMDLSSPTNMPNFQWKLWDYFLVTKKPYLFLG